MPIRYVCFAAALLALAGCSSTNFTGSGKKAEQDANKNEDGSDPGKNEPGKPGGDPNSTDPSGRKNGLDDLLDEAEIPEDCSEAGATQAKLLTQEVANGSPGNFIEYEISITDCEGKKKRVAANSILFDIDAVTDKAGTGLALRYELKNQGISGILEEVRGSYLFGKVGPNYYHNKTDKAVEFDAASNSVILRIELMGTSYKSFGGTGQVRFKLPTYLRFGDAAPVRKDVTFVGLGAFANDL